MTSPHHYEIRVAGTLPPEALLDFDQLNASVEPVGTMLHGVLPDQAALYGLLTRLEALGARFTARRADLEELRRTLRGVRIAVACDVRNPLLGPDGAARFEGELVDEASRRLAESLLRRAELLSGRPSAA